MIQRIQTVYLLLAAILLVICACIPVGTFYPDGIGASMAMYNLCIITEDQGWQFGPCALFVLLALATVNSVTTIFGYNNRKKQSSNCLVTIVILLAWVAYYVFYTFVLGIEDTKFHMEFPAVLPLIAIVLVWLARRGIQSDERLVRAADRIR